MRDQTTVNRRYRVDRQVGEGGMAVVYRGHDLLLGRDVAIKALRPQFAADPLFRARFEREAQAAAGFSHPHVIDIYDVGEEDGTPYIVMEFVRGQTLKEVILAEGPFHPDDVAALLEQVGSALDYAHERGYVHRDVKPQNILVDERGVAKVVDFGIAKGLADSDLTDIGGGLGTVGYLSPEQASGLMATPASDVYSAGVVAFEMLTRRLPFEADSPVGVAMRHVHDAPPRPSALTPHVPPAVDAIVLRALAKDPTKRFRSAGALAWALADWRHGPHPAPAPAQAPTASTPLPVAAAATAPDPPVPIRPVAPPPPAARAAPPVEVAWSPRERSTRLEPAAAPARPAPARAATTRPAAALHSAPRDEVGCLTWVVGTALLAGLIALIYLGFRLSERLDGPGAGPPGPSDTRVPAAHVAAPTPPPTPSVPLAPASSAGDDPGAAAPTEPAVGGAPARVPVPNLIDLPLPEAQRLANGRGFVVEEAAPLPSERVPAGAVAAQDPRPAAALAQGGRIRVNLSAGSDRVDLAALGLIGRDAATAEELLRQRGLAVVREEVPDPAVAPGLVIAVDPPGRVAPGHPVTLRVSAGDRVRIPGEIQGQPLAQVERQLEGLGLTVANRLAVDLGAIEAAGLDPVAAGIVDGDVVGIQGEVGAGVDFGALVPRGTTVDVVYYDRRRDRPE